jgi:hypothetical protein
MKAADIAAAIGGRQVGNTWIALIAIPAPPSSMALGG